MNDTPLHSLFNSLQLWLSRRKHRERIALLLTGWVIIYTVWYIFLYNPVQSERLLMKQESTTLEKQIAIFTTETKKIESEATERVKNKKQTTDQSKFGIASASDADNIIKQMLNIDHKVQFINLKSGKQITQDTTNTTELAKPLTGNNVEITFNSDYFNTISYLAQLESLPWCLSWNSILYKVNNYPLATVTINLLIVSNN